MFEFRSECSVGIRKEVDLLKLKDGYQKKNKNAKTKKTTDTLVVSGAHHKKLHG